MSTAGARYPGGAAGPREFCDHHAVAQRGSVPVALILLVPVLFGVAVAIVAPGSATGGRVAVATVLDSTPCTASAPGELVDVQLDNVHVPARLDGCGHAKGERIQVEVPAGAPTRNLVVHIHASAVATAAGSASSRLNWVLGTLAAISGGGYVLLLRSRSLVSGPNTAARGDGISARPEARAPSTR